MAGSALKVKTALLFHRNVRATKTDVNVKDGIVSLSGEASSMAQKELTTEYAKDVEGVKEVKNEMTVAKAPAKPDETLARRLTTRLSRPRSSCRCCLTARPAP